MAQQIIDRFPHGMAPVVLRRVFRRGTRAARCSSRSGAEARSSAPRRPVGERAEREDIQRLDGGTGESVGIELDFSELSADIRVSNITDKTRWFAVFGEKGALLYDDLAPDKLTLYGAASRDLSPGSGTPVPVSAEPPLRRAVEAFVSAIAQQDTDLRGLELGVSVVEVFARCAEVMSRTGRS